MRSELVNLRALGSSGSRALLQRTYALEGKIFRNAEPFDAYAQRVLDADATEAWVWTLCDDRGELVGYNVIVYHDLEYRGSPIGVYHANVGLLPEYRRHNRTVSAGLRLAIPRLLREPKRRLYLHAYLLHPSIYVMLDEYAEEMWPSPRTDPASPEIIDLLAFLSRGKAPPSWDPSSPWVVRLPSAIADDDAEMAAWQRSDRPSVRYFFEKNPHYREGGALVMLVPLTISNLLRAAARLSLRRFSRR